MAKRQIAEYRQSYILRIMATAVLLFIAFLSSSHGGVVLGCFILLMLIWIWGFKEKILLYPHQLKKESLFGETVVPFNARTEFYYQFVSVSVSFVPVGQHTYITVKNGPHKVKMNSNIKDIEALRQSLIQVEIAVLKSHVEQSIQNKTSLDFGVLKVSAVGVAYRNKMLTYAEIEDFGVENGEFYMKKIGVRGHFFKISISEIPNMSTFFALLEYYFQQKLIP